MSKQFLLVPAFALGLVLAGCDRAGEDSAAVRGDATTAEQRADRTMTERRAEQPADTAPRSEERMGERVGDAVSDSTITAEVKTALASDPELSAMRIDVDTKEGVVTLSGPAPDEQAKSRATQIAASPKGVMRVENRLEVKSS